MFAAKRRKRRKKRQDKINFFLEMIKANSQQVVLFHLPVFICGYKMFASRFNIL